LTHTPHCAAITLYKTAFSHEVPFHVPPFAVHAAAVVNGTSAHVFTMRPLAPVGSIHASISLLRLPSPLVSVSWRDNEASHNGCTDCAGKNSNEPSCTM